MKTETFNGKSLTGTIFTIGSPQVAEMIADAGFDWVLLDMEHSALSLSEVQTAIRILGDKILKIVRVPGNDEIWIKRVLDTGCDGILVPMVMNSEEASKAVASSKYPVTGNRSVGVTRAHKFGKGFTEYVSSSNDNIQIMIQIEHIEAVNNLDEILSVEGLDSIFIGPYDLSASMGLTGQVSHPDVRSAIGVVKTKCKEAGVPYGIFGMTPEAVAHESKEGCTFILCGIDVVLLSGAYNTLAERLAKQ